MTCLEWWRRATAVLSDAGCEDAGFDSRCLLEDIGGCRRGSAPDQQPLSAETERRLEDALRQRAAGRPLQYILGEWDFLTLTLQVGEGVLIPRQDTEVLCETVACRLSPDARILDLCAGSGCVGLGIASLCPQVTVTAVERSEEALYYLRQNIARYPRFRVEAVEGNVLTDFCRFSGEYDAVVANPPYIPTAELDGLQREVQHEPRMALDGDADGLRFYAVIANDWGRLLRPGGILAVEVGCGQAGAVSDILSAAGFSHVGSVADPAGIQRVVIGEK